MLAFTTYSAMCVLYWLAILIYFGTDGRPELSDEWRSIVGALGDDAEPVGSVLPVDESSSFHAMSAKWNMGKSPLGRMRDVSIVRASGLSEALYWAIMAWILYGGAAIVATRAMMRGMRWHTLCVWASLALAGYAGLGPIADIPGVARFLFAAPFVYLMSGVLWRRRNCPGKLMRIGRRAFRIAVKRE
jgi:hypothetical protein